MASASSGSGQLHAKENENSLFLQSVCERAITNIMIPEVCDLVRQVVEKEYGNLKITDNIHIQCASGRLMCWRGKTLKYENINKNNDKPKRPDGSYDYSSFDYRVAYCEDFAMLFLDEDFLGYLPEFEFNGRNVLSVLSEVPVFSATVQACAADIEASCDSRMDQAMFLQMFEKMKELVRGMSLPQELESCLCRKLEITEEDWQTYGFSLSTVVTHRPEMIEKLVMHLEYYGIWKDIAHEMNVDSEIIEELDDLPDMIPDPFNPGDFDNVGILTMEHLIDEPDCENEIVHLLTTDFRVLEEVMSPGSSLLRPIAKALHIRGVKHWRELAQNLKIPLDKCLKQLKEEIESPAKNLFEVVLAESDGTTLLEVVKALREYDCNDAIQIINDHLDHNDDVPSYVDARGPEAVAAFLRAKESGKILDRRVKVLLIGQDRVGKTSVVRSLKGEQFRAKEMSTDGVQMHEPLKNPGNQPWKNSVLESTAYDHKCAECVGEELMAKSIPEQNPQQHQQKISNPQSGLLEEITTADREIGNLSPYSVSDSDSPSEDQALTIGSSDDEQCSSDSSDSSEEPLHVNWSPIAQDRDQAIEASSDSLVQTGDVMPNKIANLVQKELDDKVAGGIWPVIWDFAGQALYRAVHPIFMTSKGIYVLVWDLRNKPSATAQCRVNIDGSGEVDIPVADSSDTNLDHIMRWLDLVNTLRDCENREVPCVILVGTHADRVNDASGDMDALMGSLCRNARLLSNCIASSVIVDNTCAGQSCENEDPGIIRLREDVLKLAENLPHTKAAIPLKWLELENEVYDHAKKGKKYMRRQQFKMEIVDKIFQFDVGDDLEHVINFLHDRGSLVYHDHADNREGLVVLDPQWLIKVLYEIITVKMQRDDSVHIRSLYHHLQDKGILHAQLLDHACENLGLHHIKYSLLSLMKKFNLLCEGKDKDGKPVYLVPCMLTTEPTEGLMGPISIDNDDGSSPVYLTFDTNYVPGGMFPRLLVLFGEWAASRTTCEQQQFYANAARLFVGEDTCLGFACYKTVIKIHLWTMESKEENPLEGEPEVSSEVYRVLKANLEKLRQECHWLRAVSWQLCGQCKLCPGKVDPKTRKCFRHQELKCFKDDCAHYVPIDSVPFACKDANGPNPRLPRTWIQALCRDITSQEQTEAPPAKRSKVMKEKGVERAPGHKKAVNSCEEDATIEQMTHGGFLYDLQQMERNVREGYRNTNLSVALRNIASDKGLVVSDNQGGGNCMFHALSEQLGLVKEIKITHHELRHEVVQYLKNNPKLPDGTELFNFVNGYTSWDTYLTDMAVNGTWGDHVILHGAANRFRTCIHVISSLPHHKDVIINPDVASSNPLMLGHVHELHYVSLIPPKPVKDVSHNIKEGSPSYDELEGLSRKIKDWKALGRRLNFHKGVLHGFHKDNEEWCNKAYAMLRTWKEREGSAATYQLLHKALCHKFVNHRDLAEEFCNNNEN